MQKMDTETSPRPLVNFGKQPKTLNAYKKLLSKQGLFKKTTLLFPMHPDPFYVQDYEKNNGPGTSYQSLLDYKNYLEKSIFSGICHHSNFDSFWKKGF